MIKIWVEIEVDTGEDVEKIFRFLPTPRDKARALLSKEYFETREETYHLWYITVLKEAAKDPSSHWTADRTQRILGISEAEAREVMNNLVAFGNFSEYKRRAKLNYILRNAKLTIDRVRWERLKLDKQVQA